MKNRHDNPVASLEYARVNKSIIYFTTRERKSPINRLSHSKILKTQQVEGLTHPKKASDFLVTAHRDSTFAPPENLAYISFFAKFFVSVKFLIP